MNRGEIVTRVLQRMDRSDATADTLCESMINEVIREIEREFPWAYTKKSQTAAISANVKSFSLPSNLILHHPFTLLLEDAGTSASPEYTYVIKAEENYFDMNFPAPNTTGTIAYWKLTGGTSGVGFDVYPVPDAESTLKIASGHYYTGAWAAGDGGDMEENWLTDNQVDLVIDGVSAKMFEHYGQPNKADRAFVRYQQLLMKAKVDQRDMDRRGRMIRAKTYSDMPLSIAQKKAFYGY
ncbi:MAG: hypothetical protein C4555_03100 [Dehalococcoidia bacterium]|nr:MAG: hypothetical protein C4555_03100 [Dehalococcoidia bacterium]